MKKILFSVIAVVSAMIATAQTKQLDFYKGETVSYSIKNADIDSIKIAERVTNDYDFVDLGLSVKWATCNVGATNSEEYGEYFAWGDIDTKKDYSVNASTYNKSVADYSGDATRDVATAQWKGTWRVPTKAEADELVAECTWEEVTVNGVMCYKVTSKVVGFEGNFIYLPCAGVFKGTSGTNVGSIGRYWTSTPGSNNTTAYSLYFPASGSMIGAENRNTGRSIRPVTE